MNFIFEVYWASFPSPQLAQIDLSVLTCRWTTNQPTNSGSVKLFPLCAWRCEKHLRTAAVTGCDECIGVYGISAQLHDGLVTGCRNKYVLEDDYKYFIRATDQWRPIPVWPPSVSRSVVPNRIPPCVLHGSAPPAWWWREDRVIDRSLYDDVKLVMSSSLSSSGFHSSFIRIHCSR